MKTLVLLVTLALTANIAFCIKCRKGDIECYNKNFIDSYKKERKNTQSAISEDIQKSGDSQKVKQYEHKGFKDHKNFAKIKKFPKFEKFHTTEKYNQKNIFNNNPQLTERPRLKVLHNSHYSKEASSSNRYRINGNERKLKSVDINANKEGERINNERSLFESPAFHQAQFFKISPFLREHSVWEGETDFDKVVTNEWKKFDANELERANANVALKKDDKSEDLVHEKLTSGLMSARKMLQLPPFVSLMQNPILGSSSLAESVTEAFKKINENNKSLWKTFDGASTNIFDNFNISKGIFDNLESSTEIFNNFGNFTKSIHQVSDRFSKMFLKLAKTHNKMDKYLQKNVKKCSSLKNLSNESLADFNAGCVVCKAITSIIYFQVKFANATIEIIEKAIQKICNVFPYAKDECDFFLKHIDQVVQLVLKGLSPQKICEELKYCNETFSEGKFLCEDGVIETKKDKVEGKFVSRITSWISSDGFGCSTCKFVSKAIHVVMESTNSTNEMITQLINDTCSLFSNALETCDHYVTKGGELVELIRSQTEPVDVCKKIMKCNNDMSFNIFQSVISASEVENIKSKDSSESSETKTDIDIEKDELNKIEEPLVKSDSQSENSMGAFVASPTE